MEQIRLGIIGIGNMGSEHARIVLSKKTPDILLCAVADPRPERQAWARQSLPEQVLVFQDGEALINSKACDAVLIATPHYQHPDLTIKALEAGLHVLCEKPIGVYTKNVHAIEDAARKSGKAFALMFNQRSNGVYRKLREIIKGGQMGAVKRVNWTITDWYRSQIYYDSGSWRATWQGEGGGALINQCPHQLDLLQWIFGMPESLRAFCHEGKWHDIEVEDDVTAYLTWPNGATGVFITSTADLPGVNRLEITCDLGRITCDGQGIVLHKLPVSEREICFTTKDAFYSPDVEVIKVQTDGHNPQHLGVLQAFAGHILRGEPLVAEGIEGIHSLALSNAMYLSSWTGQTVTLPHDEDLFLTLLNQKRATGRKKDGPNLTFLTDHSRGGRLMEEDEA